MKNGYFIGNINPNIFRQSHFGESASEDNPVVRAAVAEALTDQRPLLPVFIFDPRFLDRALGSIWTHRVLMDVYGGFGNLCRAKQIETSKWSSFTKASR